MARLIVNPGSPNAWEIQLKPGVNSIGRGADNDFTIGEGSVSTHHCQVEVLDGAVVIRDLGSTNGTFLNGQRVQETTLRKGGSIRLGGVEMAFLPDDQAPSAPPDQAAAPRTVVVIPGPSPVARAVPSAAPAAPPPPAPAPPAIPSVARPVRQVNVLAGAAPASAALRANAPAVAVAREVPAAQPAPAPVTTEPVAVGPQNCKFHPKMAARLMCGQCQEYFCEACVAIRQVEGVRKKFCRHCGAEVIPVQVHLQRTVEKGFLERLPGAFLYPLRGVGFIIVIVGIVLFAMLYGGYACIQMRTMRMIMFGIILEIFAGGYLFTYLQSILHSTTAEDKELPELPGIGNFLDDVVLPFCGLLGLILLCFGPGVGLAIWWRVSDQAVIGYSSLGALAFGLLYFPMAFLCMAILDSIVAANPLLVVPSILKIPLEYLFSLLVFGAVWGVYTGGNFLVHQVLPEGLSTKSMGQLVAWMGATAFLSFLVLYLLIVGVHILGLMYLSRKTKLGWLDR
jgi:hypothetical protein